jgi:hypothetical protein
MLLREYLAVFKEHGTVERDVQLVDRLEADKLEQAMATFARHATRWVATAQKGGARRGGRSGGRMSSTRGFEARESEESCAAAKRALGRYLGGGDQAKRSYIK